MTGRHDGVYRRRFLGLTGGLAVGTVTLTGCLGEEGETDPATTKNEDSEVDDTGENESEEPVDTDEDDIRDMTGQDVVEIELGVGGEGDDGEFSFDPDHVRIDAGTTVRWINTHDVFHTVTSTDSLESKTSSGEFDETLSAAGDEFE